MSFLLYRKASYLLLVLVSATCAFIAWNFRFGFFSYYYFIPFYNFFEAVAYSFYHLNLTCNLHVSASVWSHIRKTKCICVDFHRKFIIITVIIVILLLLLSFSFSINDGYYYFSFVLRESCTYFTFLYSCRNSNGINARWFQRYFHINGLYFDDSFKIPNWYRR